jgi:hypothetical protein
MPYYQFAQDQELIHIIPFLVHYLFKDFDKNKN